ncbi:MAG: 50S ribosomal protein L13 [Phycisphaerae bacterium]|nr:50S ribosomal protein L13 [Phycisphaerae bacterium]
MSFVTDKCYQAKTGEVERKWYWVDAEDKVLGRLAVKLATVLMGKHKPTYTPHIDTGDFVVVTNAEKVKVTGRKAEQKQYDSYSYYPGGRRVKTFIELRENHPDRIIKNAVRRMLPKSAMGRRLLTKLKVYRGGEHPHQAQECQPLDLNAI